MTDLSPEALADDGRYAEAAEAQRRALAQGGADEQDGREMLAWYLLKAGQTTESEQLWDELLTERPDDADLALTAGVANLDAERPEQAAALLERSIRLSLAGTLDAPALREAVTERGRALQAAGLQPSPIDDHAAKALDRLERQAEGDPIAVPWYPADAYAVALERIEGFKRDWGGTPHEDYSRELDRRLRDVSGLVGRSPLIVPVQADAYLAFAESTGLDPDWAETRARYADEHRADAIGWPPGRNDDCWCGVAAKYKRHCGA